MRRATIYLIGAAFALLMIADHARPGMLLAGDNDGGGGTYINIIMREVKVTPVHAHIGDVIRVDMVVENQGDLWNETSSVDLVVNGRIVDSRMYNYGFSGEGGRIFRASFTWDTRGAKPGEYKIRGDAFVWYDASPFDNYLDVKEPVVLLQAGAAFPAGQAGGGTAVERDPRYKPAASPVEGSGKASGGAAGSGY